MMNVALNNTNEIIDLTIDSILPSPYQPRKSFDRAALEELAFSIRQYGVLQPIGVRLLGERYELVMGERRLRAAKLVGLKSIPAVVLCVGDRDSAALGLIENIQRRSLFYLEEAEAMQTIMTDFGITQGELAHILGKSRTAVACKLRLLRLSPTVKQILQKNSLSEGYARALLRLSSEAAQKKVLEQVTKYSLNLRRTEELIDSTIRTGEIGILKRKPSVKLRFKDVRAFAETVRTTVEEMSRSGIETEYKITQHDDRYEIRINIKTAVNKSETD